ncbi:hypothetical protein PYJP_10270 [Pyrofollis japonicus]|nr:hypothetical protein PYJP_10270 [Pyrofollis japonicus]
MVNSEAAAGFDKAKQVHYTRGFMSSSLKLKNIIAYSTYPEPSKGS